jgi:MFS transporter, YNFM family, putative membrane transport protein
LRPVKPRCRAARINLPRSARPAPTLPIALAGFAAFLDLYATQPLLPLLARTFHASNFAVSLTVTAPIVAVALAAPIVGRLADRFGLRRVILGSAFALTITTALAASSATLHQLIFWRFVQGLVTPGIFASAIAYIHEEWPAGRVGRGTSAYVSGTVLGGFSGRAMAGLVAADMSWPAAFVALAALTAAVTFVLLLWLPKERSVAATVHERRLSQWGSIVRHFQNRQLVTTYAIGFCVLFTQVAMFTYVTFHLAAPPYLLSTAALGWLFVVYLIGAVATPLAGRWIEVYGHRIGLGAAMAVGGGGALLTLVPWLPAVVAGLTLSATGVFIAQATTSSYIGAVTTEDRGLAVGLYSTFYYAGGSVGAALPAALWRFGGWAACVALVIAVQSVGVAIALTQWADSR